MYRQRLKLCFPLHAAILFLSFSFWNLQSVDGLRLSPHNRPPPSTVALFLPVMFSQRASSGVCASVWLICLLRGVMSPPPRQKHFFFLATHFFVRFALFNWLKARNFLHLFTVGILGERPDACFLLSSSSRIYSFSFSFVFSRRPWSFVGLFRDSDAGETAHYIPLVTPCPKLFFFGLRTYSFFFPFWFFALSPFFRLLLAQLGQIVQ